MKEYIIILITFAVIFAVAWIMLSCLRKRFAADDDKREAVIKAQLLCEKLLSQVALALLTEAERKFGDGTGKLKMSYVLERFLALLPDWVQELIDPDWLTEQLEFKLSEAKQQWKANDKLVGLVGKSKENSNA